MFEIALFLYLFQVHDPATPYPPMNRRSPGMRQPAPDFWLVGETRAISGDALKEKPHEFVRRFNRLMTALSDFASTTPKGKMDPITRQAWMATGPRCYNRMAQLQTAPTRKELDEHE